MDAQTLSALRDNQELFMTDRVTILKYEKTQDEFGGETFVLSDEIISIGRIQIFSPEEKITGEQVSSEIDAEVFLPFDAVVTSTDIISISEERYSVVGTNEGYSERLTLTVQVKNEP